MKSSDIIEISVKFPCLKIEQSASSLSGAYLVNPWNTHALANAMHDSITMSEDEKKARFDVLSRYVHTHTASNWGESFIKGVRRYYRSRFWFYTWVAAEPQRRVESACINTYFSVIILRQSRKYDFFVRQSRMR